MRPTFILFVSAWGCSPGSSSESTQADGFLCPQLVLNQKNLLSQLISQRTGGCLFVAICVWMGHNNPDSRPAFTSKTRERGRMNKQGKMTENSFNIRTLIMLSICAARIPRSLCCYAFNPEHHISPGGTVSLQQCVRYQSANLACQVCGCNSMVIILSEVTMALI